MMIPSATTLLRRLRSGRSEEVWAPAACSIKTGGWRWSRIGREIDSKTVRVRHPINSSQHHHRTFTIRRERRSEEHTSELQSRLHLVCRLLLEKKKKKTNK